MDILIAGTGYVGLVTGACFAEMGNNVICLDIDSHKIDMLNKGILPFFEPGLAEMVQRNKDAGRLSFTNSYEYGVKKASLCFLATPTPSLPCGTSDTSSVIHAAVTFARHATTAFTLVIKSTVPVGTAHIVETQVRKVLEERSTPIDFAVVSNPEFLKEGSAVADCMKPDRIIIGTNSTNAMHCMKKLYTPFTHNHDRLLFTNQRSAEMIKYASNAMLASRISFMNELSILCESLGANINEVRVGMGADARIGYDFLYAGIGYGGSCFPKDLAALRSMGRSVQTSTPLLDAIDTVNQKQKNHFYNKIDNYFNGDVSKKVIAIWGLSFKPNTDDMREAPSLCIIRKLIEKGALVRLYDPIATEKAQKILGTQHPQIEWCQDEYKAAKGAHAIALLTEWKQFRFVDLETVLASMQDTAFFDGRNQYDPQEMSSKGFAYFGIGIPS